MDEKRQKNQLVLAFLEEDRGEASKCLPEGTESSAGKRGIESPAITEQLMEAVCERENCTQALKRVKANKGSAGVDGMTVQQLPEHLKQHWPAIRVLMAVDQVATLAGPGWTTPRFLDSDEWCSQRYWLTRRRAAITLRHQPNLTTRYKVFGVE